MLWSIFITYIITHHGLGGFSGLINGLIAAAIGALSMLMSEPTAKSYVNRTRMFVLSINRDITYKVCKGQGTPSSRGRNRFVPYSRGYRRGRGRGARTSTYTSQSGYQQPEVNKKPTKGPNNWYINNSKLLDIVNAQKPFVAGRTNHCLSEWVKLTTGPEFWTTSYY